MSQELSPSSDVGIVICLSNVCVSPNERRRGIAETLCQTAEEMLREEVQNLDSPLFGIEEVFLRVESDNTAAKSLYENKLGYKPLLTHDIYALRVEPKSGTFVAQTVQTTIMNKSLS